jgi:hypothetical protein
VPDRIPALPSTQKYHDFLQLRYIEPRKISSYQDLFHGDQPFVIEAENAEVVGDETLVSDAKSFMKPDETTTRIPRKAGKLTPRVRKGREFEPLLCTRQVITAWFEKNDDGSVGWTGSISSKATANTQLTSRRCNTARSSFQTPSWKFIL